ncbi:hypothetical protein HQQ81_19990 [Microbacteriaceae bacterium VKM Ac-2854]|nr:hypothetical protein [Microbacteriaceae bacterium VKM Ac-2854]
MKHSDIDLSLSHDLSARGIDPRSLRPDRAKGRHRRLKRGVFVEAASFDSLPDREQHLLRARAVRMTRGELNVLALYSAAALHDLPLASWLPQKVHLLGHPGEADGADIVRHRDKAGPEDIEEIDGFLVTSLERTLIDLARLASREDAVIALDHALRPGPGGQEAPVQRAALLARLATLRGVRGVKQARFVVAFADGGSGSPGESLSRLRMKDCGIPTPQLQVPHHDRRGLAGITDFGWTAFGLVGEFDGKVKYTRAQYLNGRTVEEVVLAEKVREDRIRATGPRMSRWGSDDLRSTHGLCAILSEAGLPTAHGAVPLRAPR